MAAVIPAALSFAGSIFSAFGASKAKKAARRQAKAEAAVANAQADDALARGNFDEERYLRQVAQVVGRQRAVIGASNVKRSGTALDLLSDTAQIGAQDALTIRNNAAREAWGYRMKASEASRYGRARVDELNQQIGSTLLTGAAQAYGLWKK